jgi:hypothetical protein
VVIKFFEGEILQKIVAKFLFLRYFAKFTPKVEITGENISLKLKQGNWQKITKFSFCEIFPVSYGNFATCEKIDKIAHAKNLATSLLNTVSNAKLAVGV